MKKCTHFAALVLVALIFFAPFVKAQDCNFTPNIYPGQAADRTLYEVSATVAVGEIGRPTNLYSQVSNLVSSNESVAMTGTNGGYNAVLLTGTGTADVTYTENWFITSAGGGGVIGGSGGDGGTSVCSTNHTIHYTVVKGTPRAQFTYERKAITEFHVAQNSGFNAPSAEIIIKAVKNGSTYPEFEDSYIDPMSQMSFTSSNTNVAIIGRGNSISLTNNIGQTTITATWPGNANWEPVSISYTLYVEAPKQTAYISFSPTMQYTDTVGNTLTVMPTTMRPENITIDRWMSTNPDVASVNEQTGEVTMLSAGTTQILAIFNGNDNYYAAQGYYFLTVVKRNPGLYFDETEVYAELNVPFTPPTFHNPHNVPINKWNSQNPNVAEISEDGSIVTIKGLGDALIFCESFDTQEYSAQSVSYTIHVTSTGLTVAGVLVNKLNAADILGDGTASYDKTTHTLTLSGFVFDGNAMPTIPAHRAPAAGGISNAVIAYSKNDVLYIVVDSSLVIRNTDVCIAAPQSAILMRGSERGGYATLNANTVAVSAVMFKIHQCWVSASGNSAAIALGSQLGVSRGSYLLASSNGMAIQCASFVKAEEYNGEGIEILTEGVIFNQKQTGFYTEANGQPAHLVEIGKVPVVVPADEITTIDFTQTDPEGNESVVFSASEENTFNEETGQLEISTTLTEEDVESALETLIPGSSAWMSMLPGSLVFDIPAGQGEIQIQCMTFPGYSLHVKMADAAAINLIQTSLGWVTVQYDVAEPVHVVIYLHADTPDSAPARIASSLKEDEPAAGAYIQAVKITPADAPNDPTGLQTIEVFNGQNGKIIMNGQLFILRDGHMYNATGVEIK